MKIDTLDYTMVGVLSMECSNGWWRLITYLSKSLNETERNYEIYDKKILAVIRRLENQKHLLKGAKLKFEVWTDHKNLEYFMKVQKLNKRQTCYVLYLSRFNFTLKHIPETKEGKQIEQKARLENWDRK